MKIEIIEHQLNIIEFQIECLLENKPIEWKDSVTGEINIATTNDTLNFVLECITTIRMEMENDKTK